MVKKNKAISLESLLLSIINSGYIYLIDTPALIKNLNTASCVVLKGGNLYFIEVSKGAKIRNRYT